MSTPALFSDQDIRDAGGQPSPTANTSASAGSTLFSDDEIQNASLVPSSTGEITNDVGQTVIVPKDGESFSDTVNRAIAHQKSMTPQQQQAAIDAEVHTMPAKTAETLAGAAGIGVAGPGMLAALGEGGSALYELAVKHLAGSVLPGMEEEAAKAKLLQLAPKVLDAATKLGIGTAGIHYLWKAAIGGK